MDNCNIENLFSNACKSKNIQTIQIVYENYGEYLRNPRPYGLNSLLERAFKTACFNEDINVMVWGMSTITALFLPNSPRQSYYDEIVYPCIFYNICKEDKLRSAEWLFQNGTNKPKLNKMATNVFPIICGDGQLQMAQLLYRLCPSIDIRADDDSAVRNALLNEKLNEKNLPTAQWLQTLVPPYVYQFYALKKWSSANPLNKCLVWKVRILSNEHAREARWQQIKLIVWLSSNNSPHKDSFMYKLPVDVSRHILQTFL